MEKEIKFDENTTRSIRAIREKVAGGKPGTRALLLAYAYLKDKEYITLETKINEDHESFGSGRETFIEYLSLKVFHEIAMVAKENKIDSTIERIDIFNWMMEKYNTVKNTEEKAA